MSATPATSKPIPAEMKATLDRQRAALLADGPPSAEIRIDRLNRCIALLVDHQDEIADALNKDFGNRSPQMSKFTDVASSIGSLKHARDHLRSWMKAERRRTTPMERERKAAATAATPFRERYHSGRMGT